jgi:hypothetical protein
MSPVKAKVIGAGGRVVVVVVDVDVVDDAVGAIVVAVVSTSGTEVGLALVVTFGLFAAVETVPWSRFVGGRNATGGNVAGLETTDDSPCEQATKARQVKSAVSRPRIG